MALLKRIMHPHLNSAGPHTEHIDKLSEWQLVVREYERISGKELDETVKMVALIEEAPLQLQEHHRLRYEEIGTDHKKVILSTCAGRGHGFWRSRGGHWRSQRRKRAAQRQAQRQRKKQRRQGQRDRPKRKAKAKERAQSPSITKISGKTPTSPIESVLFYFWHTWTFCDCDHRGRTANLLC